MYYNKQKQVNIYIFNLEVYEVGVQRYTTSPYIDLDTDTATPYMIWYFIIFDINKIFGTCLSKLSPLESKIKYMPDIDTLRYDTHVDPTHFSVHRYFDVSLHPYHEG